MTEQEQHDELLKDLDNLVVESVTIKISARRSIRAVGPSGDEFRTAESEESWTISNSLKSMSPDLAYAAGMKFTPLLIKKVMFDLVVAGVITKDHAMQRTRYAAEAYSMALGAPKHNGRATPGNQRSTDQEVLRGTSDPLSSSGEEPSEGSAIPPREDSGVSSEAGPSSGHVVGSPPTLPIDPNSSQKP